MTFNNKLRNLFEEEGSEQEETDVKEKSYLSDVSLEEANSLLEGDCSDHQKQQLIYHLIDRVELDGKEGDFFVYDPLVADRSYNKLYNVMFMDKSPAWEEFPARKNAVVRLPQQG